MGDPAGIGPELCLRALHSPEIRRLCTPVLFGSIEVLQSVSRALPLEVPRDIAVVDDPNLTRSEQPVVVNCRIELAEFQPGKVSAECGAAGFACIKTAIEQALGGSIDAVVTAPIHKESLRLAGVPFPGHTEIFTALTSSKRTCMMLRSDVITVSMVTTHVGYADVPEGLSTHRVLDVIELTADALHRMIGRTPRLAVCGLNPHAGENGLFGQREEQRLIEPAIKHAQDRGISVAGPLPPDTAFTTQARERFDGIVCMYHDQGHIPFKMLAFDQGVNITLGLPIVRTSVDHGTAFDIAWKGVAKATSLLSAIKCAVQLHSQKGHV
jgi:4-hydroxythreonine-4-phosphate dehydrogenase